METVWTAFIWAFRILSKMAARSWIITPPWPLVSLFLRFLFSLNIFLFYGCFPLDFVWKWYEIKLKELKVEFFRFLEVWMKKTDVHIFVWRATPAIQWARRFFHAYLKETKKLNNQFLIILKQKMCFTRKMINSCQTVCDIFWAICLLDLKIKVIDKMLVSGIPMVMNCAPHVVDMFLFY